MEAPGDLYPVGQKVREVLMARKPPPRFLNKSDYGRQWYSPKGKVMWAGLLPRLGWRHSEMTIVDRLMRKWGEK